MLPEGEANRLDSAAAESIPGARRRVFKAGTIEFGCSAVSCTIRSISSVDASLDITSPLWFPDRFTLVIASDGLRKPCHLVWRREKRARVVFD
jgi:hypothetical protein